MLDCGEPLAGGVERLHERNGDPSVERVASGASAPPRHGAGMVLTRGRIARELLEGIRVRALDQPALPLDPPLELVGAGKMESVEERPVVQIDRSLQVALGDGGLELEHVDAQDLGVQPELAHPDDDLVVADLPTDGVERLVERVASALFLDVRPERADQSIAR